MSGVNVSICRSSIEPFHKLNDLSSLALITEGGGQRGVFTAGVLDVFMENNFNPFSLLIGASAGSLNLASYICNQRQHAYRVITEVTTKKHFFNYYNIFSNKGAMNLDWLIEETKTNLKLDWDTGKKNMKYKKVLACASCLYEDKAEFFDLSLGSWEDSLKASCSIPLLNRHPVYFNQKYWVDGGLSAPIPVEEAYNRGFKNLVVIRTNPKGTYSSHQWLKVAKKCLSKTKIATLIDMLLIHERNYERNEKFINDPPGDAVIYEIHPSKKLNASLVGSDLLSLHSDYEHGRKLGKYFLQYYNHLK
ncbi:patatin family protein [Vibrio lentus]